jgi:hypothetical protein
MTDLNKKNENRNMSVDELSIEEMDRVTGGDLIGRLVDAVEKEIVNVAHRVLG